MIVCNDASWRYNWLMSPTSTMLVNRVSGQEINAYYMRDFKVQHKDLFDLFTYACQYDKIKQQ